MTNNAEREAFEKYADFNYGQYLSFEKEFIWMGWRARAQASGVPDKWKIETGISDGEKWIALRTGDNFFRFWPNDGFFYWFLSDMLTSAPIPPKSASVPVEKLEALGIGLLQEVVVSLRSCGMHFSLANDVERLSNQLAELIAEYKRVEDQSCT